MGVALRGRRATVLLLRAAQRRVTTSDDPGELLALSTRIGGRYMGADRAEEIGGRNGVPGELLCRLTPDRVVAQAAIAD